MKDFVAIVLDLAHRAGWPVLYQLGLLLVAALAVFVLGKLGTPDFSVRGPSEPPMGPGKPIGSGEGGAVVDSSGNPVTADPDNPGGGPTGGMG